MKANQSRPIYIYACRLLTFMVTYLSLVSTGNAQNFTITVFIKNQDGDETDEFNLSVEDRISVLQEKAAALNYDPNSIRLEKNSIKILIQDRTLSDYNVGNYDNFVAKKVKIVDPETARKNAFLKAAWEGEVGEVKKILKSVKKGERADFVKGCRAENDHFKIAPYLAARMGFIDVLKVIKRKFTKKEFQEILAIKDDEGRTVLMAAARAVDNMKKTIGFIKDNASKETLEALDINGHTAYDWARKTGLEDKKILAKLLKISGANLYKD